MADYLITDVYRKSYLIEFFDKDGVKLEESFTFSVPPESEELTYSQRKTETKTFGGLHVDDYGIDAVKIVLSGSTINRDLKKIYRPGQDDLWLSGEEEIYFLRDLIAKYKTGKDNIVKRIMLYDLSKVYVYKDGAANKFSDMKNYWRVFPGDFKIRRSNDRPFTYKYSIEFTGIPQEEGIIKGHEAPPLTLDDPLSVKSMMDMLLDAVDFIDGINGKINDALAEVNKLSRLLNTLGSVMNYAADVVTGAVYSSGKAVTGVINAATNAVKGVNSIVSLPKAIQLSAVNIGLEVFNAAKALARSVEDVGEECRKMFDPASGYRDVPQETLDRFGMTGPEFKDSVALTCDKAENTANRLVAAAKSADIPYLTTGNPDPETGEQSIVLSYGSYAVPLKDTDTLESLAARHMGNPDRAIDIAAYNGIASLDELKPGDTIKIPITSKSGKNTANRIFARPEDRDNYGRDIALTDDGFVKASASGDFELTSGVNNLSQAVLLRLRESVNKRIRLNAYGIRNNMNDPTAGAAYIMSSIDLTVKSDPRVKSVDNIRFRGMGDGLNVEVDYRDINGGNGNARGMA
jgi:hypothetical protein